MIKEIKVDSIKINEKRIIKLPITNGDSFLVRDILTKGLYNAIIVNKLNDEKYELIGGLRRLNVYKFLGWEYIPAKIINDKEKN